MSIKNVHTSQEKARDKRNFLKEIVKIPEYYWILLFIALFSLLPFVYVIFLNICHYPAFYWISLGEIVDGVLVLLIGFFIGIIEKRGLPKGSISRKITIFSLLSCLGIFVGLKFLYYLSPVVISPECLRNCTKIISELELNPEEYIKAKIAFQMVFFALIFVTALLILISFILYIIKITLNADRQTQTRMDQVKYLKAQLNQHRY